MTLLRDAPGDTPTTEIPVVPAQRISPRTWAKVDIVDCVGAIVSSFFVTWLVYEQLTSLTGGLGFFLCWFVVFLGVYWLLVRQRHGAQAARDRFLASVLALSAAIVIVSLSVILGYTIYRGLSALRATFFTQDMRFTSPLAPASAGGGLAAIIGSAEQVGLAILISVPAGISIAVLLSEIRGHQGRIVKILIEAMNGIPSVLAALFILAIWIYEYHFPQSGFAVALALSVSMLPTVARTSAVMLNMVPGGLREASLALGSSEWHMVRRVVVPTARAGLVTAIILGVARVVGETAPAALDNAPSNSINWNPFHGPQDSLPLFVYRFIRTPVRNEITRAWTGAMVLILLVLLLFVLARLASRPSTGALRARLLRQKG